VGPCSGCAGRLLGDLARFRDGELVLLADQDHSLLATAQIAEGRQVLDRALALLGRGPYVVQAAIASLHAGQPRDRPQIAASATAHLRGERAGSGACKSSMELASCCPARTPLNSEH
jgi:hypothetical protein